MTRAATAPEPAEIAGRYQVVQRLGAGAFGTVYKAKDKILGRMLAIKTIRLEGLAASGASLDELMDRFKREAMVSAQLKHPHIVTIYDIGDADGISYLAMEFIDGVGLDRIVAGVGRLGVERAAVLGAQVADALDFAHRHNVVHRDIKPANIMVEGGDRVKVTDFGIAKVTDSAEQLTVTGSLLGTPSYMSPEQARGAALDGRSDLFSLGCVLYEMLAGRKAFTGDSITGLIFKIITEEPQPIRQLDPSLPDAVVRILARALAKSPDARYQTGREMADDLLSLTRAGATPTLRQTEVQTAPAALAEVAHAPTLQAPATLVAGTAAAQPQAKTAPPTVVARGSADPTFHVGSAAPAAARPASRTATPAAPPLPRPAARPAPTPGGRSAALFVGLAVAGLLALALAGGAAWFLFLRNREAPVAEAIPSPPTDVATPVAGPGSEPTPTAPAGTPAADPGTGQGVAGQPTQATGGAEPRAATAGSEPVSGAAPTGRRPAAGSVTAPGGTTTAGAARPNEPAAPREPAGADLSFLDRPPADIDGRAAGDALAEKYRGTGGGFGTNRRFAARARVPRDLTPRERAAAFVLLNVMGFQEAFHRKQGRYGNLAEVLPMAVSAPTSLQRNGYRFDLTVEPDGYRLLATPLAMGARPLLADDSGFVRFPDE